MKKKTICFLFYFEHESIHSRRSLSHVSPITTTPDGASAQPARPLCSTPIVSSAPPSGQPSALPSSAALWRGQSSSTRPPPPDVAPLLDLWRASAPPPARTRLLPPASPLLRPAVALCPSPHPRYRSADVLLIAICFRDYASLIQLRK
jgi:hypothetical protein